MNNFHIPSLTCRGMIPSARSVAASCTICIHVEVQVSLWVTCRLSEVTCTKCRKYWQILCLNFRKSACYLYGRIEYLAGVLAPMISSDPQLRLVCLRVSVQCVKQGLDCAGRRHICAEYVSNPLARKDVKDRMTIGPRLPGRDVYPSPRLRTA